jgi:hypothetical protein
LTRVPTASPSKCDPANCFNELHLIIAVLATFAGTLLLAGLVGWAMNRNRAAQNEQALATHV